MLKMDRTIWNALSQVTPMPNMKALPHSTNEIRPMLKFFKNLGQRWQAWSHVQKTKNTNLVEDVEILLPVKFCWILLSGFRGEVENVSANQRPGRPSCFSDRPEKYKLARGCWVLASCQVSLNSVQWCQRRSRKCEKLTTDGQRTTHDHNSALEPSAQVH